MWTYPKNQTPDPNAPKNGPSEDDLADAKKAEEHEKVKAAAKTAEKDAAIKADTEKKELKKSVADSKAAAAKEQKENKKAAEEAVKGAEPKKAPASMAQVHDEGHVDMDFKPHAILPNTLHHDQMEKIDSVAGPELPHNGTMSESVHRSSMEGGDAIPDKDRGHIKNFPMFDYPVHDPPAAAPNGIQTAPPANTLKVDPAKVAAAKETRAKEAKAETKGSLVQQKTETKEAAKKPEAPKTTTSLAEKKTEVKTEKKAKDIEGYSDASFKPHPILPNTLHNDQMEKIDSVAGPDRIDQIGESVHRSAMEGGDAIPDKSRSVLKDHPASFTP
jgi:hypothetical protein